MKQAPIVLLTGAAGFLGRHVLRQLLGRRYEVVALQHERALPAPLAERCRRVLTGDICDPRLQDAALQDVQVLCHLAAHLPEQSEDLAHAERSYRVNALATLQLAERAAARGILRFVHLSTANMYAASASPCRESASLFPVEAATAYFASKLAAELYLAHVGQRSGMPALILRVGTPYGPGEPCGKVIPSFLRLAAQGRPLPLIGGGEAKFNFVHVADVADCIVAAIQRGPVGIFNIASEEHTAIRQLAAAVTELFGKGGTVIEREDTAPAPFAGFAPLCIAKAQQTWGFAPRSLAAGLRDYRARLAQEGVLES